MRRSRVKGGGTTAAGLRHTRLGRAGGKSLALLAGAGRPPAQGCRWVRPDRGVPTPAAAAVTQPVVQL